MVVQGDGELELRRMSLEYIQNVCLAHASGCVLAWARLQLMLGLGFCLLTDLKDGGDNENLA